MPAATGSIRTQRLAVVDVFAHVFAISINGFLHTSLLDGDHVSGLVEMAKDPEVEIVLFVQAQPQEPAFALSLLQYL